MISLSGLLVFAVTLTVAAAVPGPGIATVTARVVSHGVRAGFAATMGTICGDVMWLTVAILGLAAIAKTFAVVFLAIKYLGAAYLLYLAWRLWTAPAIGIEGGATTARTRKFSNFWLGFSVTLSNPKTIMFYMAILPTLIDIAHIGLGLYAILVAMIAGILTVVFGCYILLVSQIKKALSKASAIRAMHRSTSLIMAGAAAMVAAR